MDVCIVIPTLNEERSIGEVIEGFKRKGYSNILVIDGRSTDRTVEIARSKGAKVVVQSGRGKGQAVAEAFQIVNSDIVVIVDGDGTYSPDDIENLLDPIRKGIADHVVGNRFAEYEKGAFRRINLIGNKILNLLFRTVYGVELYDILSGYRALKREVYKSVELRKSGFEVEAELTVETIAKGFRIVEVPIRYRRRAGKTKLKPFRDGIKIAMTIYELLKRYSPGRYFYFIGAFMILLGFFVGVKVVVDWFQGITHYLLATLTALLIISGLQVTILGILSDFVFRSNVQMRREVSELREDIRRVLNELEAEGNREAVSRRPA